MYVHLMFSLHELLTIHVYPQYKRWVEIEVGLRKSQRKTLFYLHHCPLLQSLIIVFFLFLHQFCHYYHLSFSP